MPWRSTARTLPPDATLATHHTVTRVRYGKYYSHDRTHREQKVKDANAYYIFSPARNGSAPRPVVVSFHGGGFTGGAASSEMGARGRLLLRNGIAYVSIDYRSVATKYFYIDDEGKKREEEFIHAGEDGRLTLDAAAAPASGYAVRVGRQELITKCCFDAAAALSDLLGRAEAFGLDVHRIGFAGSSAGGAEAHYLQWIYHQLDDNCRRFTVRVAPCIRPGDARHTQLVAPRRWWPWCLG